MKNPLPWLGSNVRLNGVVHAKHRGLGGVTVCGLDFYVPNQWMRNVTGILEGKDTQRNVDCMACVAAGEPR